jgi:hypothetical protein
MHPREVLYKSLLKDLDGVYVEVGTCFGGFAEFLLKNTPAQKLFCIDPYRKFSDTEYKDTLNSYTSDECDKKYLMTWGRLKSQFGDRVDMIRSISTEVVHLFAPESLSVCYIDGNHDYEYVRKDILAWLPKVKKGGILCGDDVEPNPVKNGSVRTDHPGGAFNYCGVHSALISIKEECPWFDYKIQDGQWYYFVK